MPTLTPGRDRSFDEVSDSQIGGVLASVVEEYGPVVAEDAFRTTIGYWHISRLEKNIQRSMKSISRQLDRHNHLTQHSGFLWPDDRPTEIPIGVNSGSDSRSIDEIPLEELAYAAHLVLDAGQEMTRDDLVLEVARLFEYSRRGERITDRINEAIDLLVSLSCAAESSVGGESTVSHVDVDANARLLDQIY